MQHYSIIVHVIVAAEIALATYGQVCPIPNNWPNIRPLPSPGTPHNWDPLDVNFLMIADGPIQCFGVLSGWEMRLTSGSPCPDTKIAFQVWRPVANVSFEYVLVGENQLNLDERSDCGQRGTYYSLDLPEQYWIPVQNNDIIGWRDDGRDKRPVRHSNSPGTLLIARRPWTCNVGSSCSWLPTGSMVYVEDIEPLLRPKSESGKKPYYVNLPATIVMDEDLPTGRLIYRVKALYEYNAQNVVIPRITYRLIAGGCSSHFTIDRLSGDVTRIGDPLSCILTISALPEGYPDIGINKEESTLDIEVIPAAPPPELRLDDPPNSVEVDTEIADTDLMIFRPSYDSTNCVVADIMCFIATCDPQFPPFLIADPSSPEVRLTFPNERNLRNWQGPMVYTVGIICSCGSAITRKEDLVVMFTNTREPPVSDLPSLVTIPETQLASDEPFHCITGVPMPPNDTRSTGMTYNILFTYPHYATGWFDISDVNGQGCVGVSFIGEGNFDFFKQDSFDLTIEVTDIDAPRQQMYQNLTIEITWINQGPSFVFPENVTGYQSIIAEQLPIGTALPDILLEVTDRDIQGNDWITYTIIDTEASFFASNVTSRIYVDELIILNSGDSSETYFLDIYVFDSYGVNATTTLNVTVYDINDHAPKFYPKTYNGTVSENDGGHEYVTTVTATDADSGDNALIRYSIIEPVANHYFEVGVESGIISLIQPISYIDHPHITFTVMATDQGDPALSDTATVFVNVIEVNNHDPELHPAYYSVEARSDLPVGDSVVQITATDKDSRSISTPSFHFLMIQDDFAILRLSGNVKTAKPLRTWETYVLGVNVVDNGLPSMHSDPAYVRIDTYDAQATLFDIYLNIPLEEFLPLKDSFLNEINSLLAPWTVLIEKVLLDKDVTVVTCYAMSSYPPVYDMYSPKVFVHRNIAMKQLRVQMKGDANQPIREPPFAAFEPFRVLPTYPYWLIDTPVGIATLVILCLLLALAIPLLILLCKKQMWLCFKPNKLTPAPQPKQYQDQDLEDYTLNYGTTNLKRRKHNVITEPIQ